MDVKAAIEARRAYRSLAPVEITEELVRDLARCAQLAPSCDNNQPARFVFLRGAKAIEQPDFRIAREIGAGCRRMKA